MDLLEALELAKEDTDFCYSHPSPPFLVSLTDFPTLWSVPCIIFYIASQLCQLNVGVSAKYRGLIEDSVTYDHHGRFEGPHEGHLFDHEVYPIISSGKIKTTTNNKVMIIVII